MAVMQTPNGLVVGLILDKQPDKGDQEKVESAKSVEKPTRGRKPKE